MLRRGVTLAAMLSLAKDPTEDSIHGETAFAICVAAVGKRG